MKTYLAEFRQGTGSLAQNAIDFYEEDGKIIKHSWAMGGGDTVVVDTVPASIDGYIKKESSEYD